MQEFDLSISVTIWERPGATNLGYYGSNVLEMRDSVAVSASSFMEAAAILAKFHELTQSMKADGVGRGDVVPRPTDYR